jgi:5-methylcytosine-specific restriction endonuclease McrA
MPWFRENGSPVAHALSKCGHCPRWSLAAIEKAVARASAATARPRIWKRCPNCLLEFPTRNAGQVYWPKACARQAKSRAKHARRRGLAKAHLSLWSIYARDRGRCGLCCGPVGRRFTPPHPRSATLDHIVPVVAGGVHEARNLQLAHFGCNSAKRERPCASQLRLLG